MQQRERTSYWWLWIGVVSLLGTAVSSIIRSYEPMSASAVVYLVVDWFVACTIYFFFGAVIGHFVDWWKLRNRVQHPLWLWLTIGLWCASTVLVLVWLPRDVISVGVAFIFPLAYGIFFPGMAYSLLFPEFVQKTLYGKLFLDVLFLIVFASWLTLTVRSAAPRAQRILLLILFAIFFLGLFGCTRALAG